MLTLLVLAATIGAEVDPTTVVMGAASDQQRTPAAAWDGTAWLTVWQDNRPEGYATGIRGTWVNATVLGPDFPIAVEAGTNPALDCSASSCLVAWRTTGVRVARVVAGVLVDATPLDVDLQPSHAPSVSCAGTRCLVVYPTYAGPLRAARFDLATGLVDTTPFLVAASALEAAVAYDGAQWVIAWSDGADVLVTRVSTTGTVGATAFVASTAAIEQRPRIACLTGQCLVSWETGSPATLRIRRVDSTGPIDASSFLVATATASTALSASQTTVAGSYAMAWTNGAGPAITHTLFSSTGPLSLGATTVPVSTGALEPALSSDGASLFIAWAAFQGTDSDIYARPASTNVMLSRAANLQRSPAVAAIDGGYLLTFEDHRATTRDLWAAQLDARGQTRDGGGLLISSAAGDQLAPAVACNATCLVAWADRRASSVGEGRTTLVSATGGLSDPTGRLSLVDGLVDKIALASSASGYLALWSAGSNLAVMPLSQAGVPTRGTPVDLGAADSFLSGGAAFGAGVYFVVATAMNASTGDNDVVAARISAAGVVLDVPVLMVGEGATGHGGSVSRQPVASGGGVFLVAWGTSGTSELRLYSSGGLPQTAPFSVGSGSGGSVIFDGVHFVLLRGAAPGLSLIRLTLDGGFVPPEVFIPISAGEYVREISLASAAPGTVLVAYSRFDSRAGVATRRVRTRLVEFDTTLDAGVSDAGVSDAGVSDAGVSDAGVSDAGVSDAGVSDAGVSDAGVSDAGVSDAGESDAGVSDAGVSDAGVSDAGVSDAGVSDAGESDAGVSDAGESDAGTDGDGGIGGPRFFGVGCGCTASPGAGEWLLLFAGVLLRRTRRSRRDGLGFGEVHGEA